MRIIDTRERTMPIASAISDADIDLPTMTLVAVVTDAVRDGRRVIGYGSDSNGRQWSDPNGCFILLGRTTSLGAVHRLAPNR